MTEHAAPQMTDANGDPEEILPGTPGSTAREDAEDHTTEDTAEVLHKEAPAPAEAEADTFSRDYVEKLRQENGKYRQRAQRADDLAHRLHTALVTATGRLADPTDLEFSEDHLEDPEALEAAVEALLTSKPHLAARRPRGDVGQGATSSGATVDLAGLLRSRA